MGDDVITLVTKSVDDTKALGAEVAALCRPRDVIVLAGDLGTGKTAFTQGLARGLGVEEPVTSPAFVLVRTYAGRLPLTHIDVYRLDHIQELVDLGIAELVDEGGVTVVEWGDVVLPALPAEFLEVRLEHGEALDDRRVRIRALGSSWSARIAALAGAADRWTAAG
ncbi:MAG TPA: tRNA (adenosine(37)-N6)-threonylcarbamoyltransferase complex ATPase subunit type 1 TsaE [Acidimicrobiales bacterium]|nr:tRNA (adenosine(37)-N6)-threonylcarbamoyltransferase complex ATPase subunit type 1 TsaE [Acidimicrobiales bacterium]